MHVLLYTKGTHIARMNGVNELLLVQNGSFYGHNSEEEGTVASMSGLIN